VTQYFEYVILLNTRLVACGPTQETFTRDNLQETYGGKLTILSDVGELMKKEEFPSREQQAK
jgi:manganese/zinc/iron transport system ATP- binding protein